MHRLKKKKKKKNASRLRPGVRGTSRGRVSHGVTVLFQNRCRDTASSTGSRYSRYLGQAFGLVKQPLRGINPLLFRKIPPPPPYDIDQLSKQSLSGRGIHFRSRNNISIMSRDIFVVSSNFRPEGERGVNGGRQASYCSSFEKSRGKGSIVRRGVTRGRR